MAWNVCLSTDNEAIQHLFAKTFENRKDISLKFCDSAEETFKEIEETLPSLLIASINLPDEDGYSLCKDLKDRGEKFPVLLIEDIFEDIDLDRCLEVQTDGFIAKPFEEDLIAEKVDELLHSMKPETAPEMETEEEKAEEEEVGKISPFPEEEEEVSSSMMAASDEEEGVMELTELIPEEETASSFESEAIKEEEVPPYITTALEESVGELEKMEGMEIPPASEEAEKEILETPSVAEAARVAPQIDREEIEKMVAEIVDQTILKSIEEKLPGMLKESLARILSDFSDSLK